MPYAIMQTSAEPPTREQLAQAFRALPSLTDLDAAKAARDAFGVLVRGLELAEAGRLLQALVQAGVEAEMVDEASLPPLPPPRPCRRAEPGPEAFVAYDHLSRPQAVQWSQVILLAAGAVSIREWKHSTEERVVGTSGGGAWGSPYGIDQEAWAITRTEHKDREEESDVLLLDVLLAEAPGRYRIRADKFRFAYLGERRSRRRRDNFLALVRECIERSDAVLNRGAYLLRDPPGTLLAYPSERAFEEETVWLLWRTFGGGKDL